VTITETKDYFKTQAREDGNWVWKDFKDTRVFMSV